MGITINAIHVNSCVDIFPVRLKKTIKPVAKNGDHVGKRHQWYSGSPLATRNKLINKARTEILITWFLDVRYL